MNSSRLRRSLLLSALVHVLVLGILRFISLSELKPRAASLSDAPVAVQLFDLPPQAQQQTRPQITQVPERVRKLPEAPVRKPAPEAPKPPASPRAPEPVTPKVAAPPPQKGGTVVDLPKPVREERPDDARLVSRYDSKAQDIGPGEGGARKPSGEQPRAMPPEISLPERYSTGKPTPPNASLEPSAPAVSVPPSVTPAAPKPPGSPPAKAESAPPKPLAPVLKSEETSARDAIQYAFGSGESGAASVRVTPNACRGDTAGSSTTKCQHSPSAAGSYAAGYPSVTARRATPCRNATQYPGCTNAFQPGSNV